MTPERLEQLERFFQSNVLPATLWLSCEVHERSNDDLPALLGCVDDNIHLLKRMESDIPSGAFRSLYRGMVSLSDELSALQDAAAFGEQVAPSVRARPVVRTGKPGRPRTDIDSNLLAHLLHINLHNEEIAAVWSVDEKTIRNHAKRLGINKRAWTRISPEELLIVGVRTGLCSSSGHSDCAE